MSALPSVLDHQDPDAGPKSIPRPIGRTANPSRTNLIVIGAVVLLVVSFGLVAEFSRSSFSGIGTSTAAITIITASAVGIERLIETFWTYIGLTRGSWWPLGPVREQLDELLSSLDESFEPFYRDAQVTMHKLQEAESWSEEKLNTAAKDLDKLKQQVDGLKQLPIDSQRVQLIVGSASQSVDYFSQKYPEMKEAAELAKLGINGVSNFIGTFKDNPGRRLISLFAGSILGLVIAAVIGLDIFPAVFETGNSVQQSALLLPHTGVALTGLLMGLGANPTHEAIRLLQEIKKMRKAQNI
jgi:hypothetical protein